MQGIFRIASEAMVTVVMINIYERVFFQAFKLTENNISLLKKHQRFCFYITFPTLTYPRYCIKSPQKDCIEEEVVVIYKNM